MSASAAPRALEAVIFDLDGVVTDTARVHALAWKALFDEYLRRRAERTGEPFEPFEIERDYLGFVDGKPRYKGVQSFLESRGIDLPFGDPGDPPDAETVCGLGNRKNEHFNERLREDGVEVFESSVELIRQLEREGVEVALVTSSKNGDAVLEAAGLSELFEVRVDGRVAAELGLKGKPDPDTFLEAARRLGVDVARSVVVEDAESGVQAGERGGFGLVLGVARHDNREALAQNGADLVVADMAEVDLARLERELAGDGGLPLALESLDRLERRLAGREPAVFLDYDGTLTPIVDRPEQATLSGEMREAVRRLAAACPTAIVSGRGLEDVARLVGLPELVYAGNHGFEIRGPGHTEISYDEGREFLEDVSRFAERASERVGRIEGAHVENKRFSLSVHYRQSPEERVPELEKSLDELLEDFPRLRKHLGKKVFEVRPRMDWHKGKAVVWLLEALELDRPQVLPLYVGDDVTDEDAFRALKGRGIGVLVAEEPAASAASYRLEDTRETGHFLGALAELVERSKGGGAGSEG